VVKGHEKAMVVEHELDVQEALTVVLHKHARLAGQLRERSFADPRVVALAKAPGYSVLSEELRKGKPDQPRIPFVCDDFGIGGVTARAMVPLGFWRSLEAGARYRASCSGGTSWS
jgi:hypothetical protein